MSGLIPPPAYSKAQSDARFAPITNAQKQLRPITLRANHVGNSTYLSASGNTSGTYRLNLPLIKKSGFTAYGISIVMPNFALNPGPSTLAVKANVEYNNKGYQLSWGGSQTLNLTPGSVSPPSDLLPIIVSLATSDHMFLRIEVAATGGSQQWPVGLFLTGAIGEGISFGSDLSFAGQFVSSGSLPANPSGPANSGIPAYSPIAILGYPTTPLAAVGIIGDSISIGTGDIGTSFGSNDTAFDNGFIRRALLGQYPDLWYAKFGDTAQNMALSMTYRAAALRYATSVLDETGVNDFSINSRTAQQVANDKLTLATLASSRGLPLYWTTITPVSTSTNNWGTAGAQTAMSANAQRVIFNDWCRAGGPIDATTGLYAAVGSSNVKLFGDPGHPVSGYFEIADTVESARNSGVWKPADIVVTDGVMNSVTNTATLTSATAGFTSAMATQKTPITVAGAGGSGADLTTYITGFTNSTTVTLFDICRTTVSAARVVVNPYTQDGTHPDSRGHKAMAVPVDVSKLIVL